MLARFCSSPRRFRLRLRQKPILMGYVAMAGWLRVVLAAVVVGFACRPTSDVARELPGVKWTKRAVPEVPLAGIAWSGNQFAAVGWGVVLTSPDGLTWQKRVVPDDWFLEGVTWGGSQFVAVGRADEAGPIIATSPDGILWTERKAPDPQDRLPLLYGVVWSGEQFVGVGPNTTSTSRDGVSWTKRRVPDDWKLQRVAWGGSSFVAVGYRGHGFDANTPLIVASRDGVTWTVRSPPVADGRVMDVASSGARFVAVAVGGDAILTSPDGVTWAAQPVSVAGGLYAAGVTWGGGQFVVVGRAQNVLMSPDGVTWTLRTAPSRSSLSDVAWSGTRLVAVGYRPRGWLGYSATGLIVTSP